MHFVISSISWARLPHLSIQQRLNLKMPFSSILLSVSLFLILSLLKISEGEGKKLKSRFDFSKVSSILNYPEVKIFLIFEIKLNKVSLFCEMSPLANTILLSARKISINLCDFEVNFATFRLI